MGYSFQLAARDLFMHHSIDRITDSRDYLINRGILAGTRNSSMCPLRGIDPTTHRTMSGRSTTELHLAPHPFRRLCK